jgi:hypothetical protein
MIDRALRVGGTCTGEHGIGQGKRSKLVAEYGADVCRADALDQRRVGSAGHSQSGEDLPVSTHSELGQRTLRKVAWRLIPFMGLLYFLAFVDRVNIGFAALTMNADLGLTPSMFGFASGIFFIAYALFEVPSNIIMERVGARLWISRIMITWGLLSAATAFVSTPERLYRAALPARRRGSRVFPGHDSLPDLLVSGGLACAHRQCIHGGAANLYRHRQSGLYCDVVAERFRPARLAVDVPGRGHSCRAVRNRGVRDPARWSSESGVADRRRTQLARRNDWRPSAQRSAQRRIRASRD